MSFPQGTWAKCSQSLQWDLKVGLCPVSNRMLMSSRAQPLWSRFYQHSGFYGSTRIFHEAPLTDALYFSHLVHKLFKSLPLSSKCSSVSLDVVIAVVLCVLPVFHSQLCMTSTQYLRIKCLPYQPVSRDIMRWDVSSHNFLCEDTPHDQRTSY